METILVSREITFDRSSQPEVLADIERLRAAGFSVFTQDSPKAASPSPTKASKPTAEAVRAAIESIRDRHGIGCGGIGALVGVCGTSVQNWLGARTGVSQQSWGRLSRLKKRSDRLPPRDPALIAESRGGLRARRLSKQPAGTRRIADDVRLQIAIARLEEGRSAKDIASAFGVTSATVRNIVREFSSQKQET
jgi:hypothetical protein